MQFEQIIEFVGRHWELVLLFIGILALLGYNELVGNKGSVDPLEAVTMINRQEALVVDVRPATDFAKGHILHALNIPMSGFSKQMGALEKHKERLLIINCNSGAQSLQACSQLRKQGFTQVYNLRGGILAWESASLPISRKGR